jgi:hypothetical protein
MMAFVFLLLDDAKNKYDAAATGHRLSLSFSLFLSVSLSLSLSHSLFFSEAKTGNKERAAGRVLGDNDGLCFHC